MKVAELQVIVDASKCQVIGWQDASNDAHRQVLAALAIPTTTKRTTILCECGDLSGCRLGNQSERKSAGEQVFQTLLRS